MKFYIYKIINKLNGKCYVGKHKTFEGESFRAYMGSGIALVEAQRKYGIANFDKEIIEEIEDNENELIVDEREKFWIKELNTISPNGYNISYGGEGGCYHVSEETKKKISKSSSGKPKSKEHIKNMRIAEFTKPYTFEYENGNVEIKNIILCDFCKENKFDLNEIKYLSSFGYYYKGFRIKEFFNENEFLRKLDRTCKCFKNPITNDYVSYWTLNQLKHRYHKPELENVEIMDLLDKTKMKINPCRWWNNGIEEHFCIEKPDETFNIGRLNKKSKKYIEFQEKIKSGKIKIYKNNRIKGKSHWYNNGSIEIVTDNPPEGFVKGSLHKNKPSEGKHYYNDGKNNVLSSKCPIGFKKGRIINWKIIDKNKK